MSKDKLIPELRFPDFKNEGEWNVKIVSEVAKYENGKAHEQDIDEKGKYVVVNSKFISTDGEVRKFSNSANCIAKKNDVLMVLSDVPNGRAIAKCFYVDKDNYYTVNQRICKISPVKVDSKLLLYLLNRNQFFLNFDDGVKQTNLRNEDVLNCPLILPKNPQEQQKIASCLSSLDEVIAAHSQKLDLLKNHKKGLMQNLFPQEGEKVPKYRFKEFEKDGEWVEDILLSLANNGFSNGVFNDPKKVGSGYKLINVINMYSESPISENNLTLLELSQSEFEKNKVEYGDIFFTRSSLVPEGIAKSNIYLGSSDDITYDGHLIRMRPKNELITSIFLHYLLKTDNVRRQMIAKGKTATMTTIGQSDVSSVEISYSKNPQEQQKIASCLSSLDSLITAQAEKIEKLKLHKKGLMQGLFPKIQD